MFKRETTSKLFCGVNLIISKSLQTSAACLKNHYDVLGITPKATQVDVKTAYYNLSKVYHPDRNKGGIDAATKFRSITEAYEVLGNVRLRRLYDKGMHHVSPMTSGSSSSPFVEVDVDDDANTRFYRSREQRHRPPPPSGRTPIYDFDEWAKAHYGTMFAKDQRIKRDNELRRQRMEMDKNDIKTERVLLAMGALLVMFMYLTSDMRNADKIKYHKENDVPMGIEK